MISTEGLISCRRLRKPVSASRGTRLAALPVIGLDAVIGLLAAPGELDLGDLFT